jgi:hypothetical protein
MEIADKLRTSKKPNLAGRDVILNGKRASIVHVRGTVCPSLISEVHRVASAFGKVGALVS